MSELSNQYRNAPRLRSSVTVDRTVLREAGRRVATEKPTGVWWSVAPALSALCVALFGVTLLMKHGVPPLQSRFDNGSTLAGKSELDSVVITSEELVAEPVVENLAPQSMEFSDRSAEVVEMSDEGVDSDISPRSAIQSTESGMAVSRSSMNDESRQMRALSEALRDETVSADSAVREPSGLVAESFSAKREGALPTNAPAVSMHHGKGWLLGQPANRFTLLIEKNDRATLGNVNELELRSAIVEVISGNSRSWILIIGSFSTRDEATKMAGDTALSALQPKVLTFGELPASLRQ